MKRILLFLLLVLGTLSWAQNTAPIPDQTLVNASDTLYKKLNTYIPSGLLLNRALNDTLSEVFQLKRALKDSTVSAKDFYLALNDLNRMKINRTPIQSLDSLVYHTSIYLGNEDFENERLIYPIGVLDYNYDWIIILPKN